MIKITGRPISKKRNYQPQTETLKQYRRVMGEMKCLLCGKTTRKKSPNQKYCPECSQQKSLERRNLWRKENYNRVYKGKNLKYGRIKRAGLGEAGLVRSRQADIKRSIDWMSDEVNVDRVFRFSVPFDQNYSKNAIWRTGRRGHVYIREEVNALREEIGWKVKRSGVKWGINKVWLDILVQKPSMRGDAINVLDTIADGIKLGMDLDDNWFCVRRLDWEIVKKDPKIFIGIAQENKDVYYCSHCGIPQPLSNFTKSKHNKFGISTSCRECEKIARQLGKKNIAN